MGCIPHIIHLLKKIYNVYFKVLLGDCTLETMSSILKNIVMYALAQSLIVKIKYIYIFKVTKAL